MAGFDVGSIRAKIDADVTGFKNGINQAKNEAKGFQDKMNSVGNSMKNFGRTATAFVTLPAVGMAAGFVKLASDAEEVRSKFETVFKDGAKTVEEELGGMAERLGRSRTDLMSYAATLQDTFVPLGFARDQASILSIELVSLSEDLASFNNLNTADVIRDLQSAMVGNTETLRKYGVVASQAAIEQEAINSGLIKNKNELDAQTKAQAIFNLTMKGTVDAQGDAARTAGSTANQMRALTSEFKAMGEELGTILIPIAQELIKYLRIAIDWFRGLDERTQKIILVVVGLVAVIGPLILTIGVLITAFSAIIPVAGAVIGIIAAIGAPILILIGIIVALAVIIVANWDTIKANTQLLATFITSTFTKMWNFLKSIGGRIKDAIVQPYVDAWNRVKELVEKIKSKLDFTKRQSPSVVDIVERGVMKVNKAFQGLEVPSIDVRGANLTAPNTTNTLFNKINVDLRGAVISDDASAMRVAEKVGDNIIKRLQTNIRF